MIRATLLAALFFASLPSLPADQTPARPKPSPAATQRSGTLQALLEQAEAALAKKDFAAAIEALKKFLAERPEDAVAHSQLAYAYTGAGRHEEARAAYEAALALDPKLAAAHQNLGLLLLETDPAAALPHLERAAELLPDRAQPQVLLGAALERLGRSAEAVAQYRRAAARDPQNPDARLALGRLLLALSCAAEAEPELRQVVALRPEFAPARLGLAESLIAQKKWEQAAGELNAYLQVQPEDHASRVRLASVLLELGRLEQALAELRRAEQGGYSSPQLYSLRGYARAGLRQFEEAIVALRQAVEMDLQDSELHARLGRLHLEQRDFSAAERALLEALRLQPKFTDALRDLAATYYLAGQYEAALRVLDRLAEHEPPSASSWFMRATSYDKLDRKAEALAAYRKFVELDRGRSEKQDFQARQRIRILTRELKKK